MKTALDTEGLPQEGDVVLLKSEPDHFAVLDYHDESGWRLIRIVAAHRLGRYRTRYPGPTRPVADTTAAGLRAGQSFVRQTKDIAKGEWNEFLAIEGRLYSSDLRAARELVR